MLKIHHLGHSQSERIVWLCEELGVPYELVKYTRDPVTRLSPPELKALHPLGAAPLIEVDGMLLGESAAVMKERLDKVLALIEARLAQNDYLAGSEFTSADIMNVFSLTTMRLFHRLDLAPYPNILAYLQRIGERTPRPSLLIPHRRASGRPHLGAANSGHGHAGCACASPVPHGARCPPTQPR